MNDLSAAIKTACTRPNVVSSNIFRGPHLYSELPMIEIRLDLGELEQWPTDRLPGFADSLLERLPGLDAHGCSLGQPGGFSQRLREGTWLGHVVEHAALELQSMVGHKVTRGKTRSVKGESGVYRVLYAYEDEEVGLAAGRLALELVDSLLPPALAGLSGGEHVWRDFPGCCFEEKLQHLKDFAAERALGPTTASLVHEAKRRGIPVRRVGETSLVILGQGSKQRRIRTSCTDQTSQVALEIACDKDLTKALLARAGLPVPDGRLVQSAHEAVAAAEELGYPVVTKPLDGNHGRGVSIGLDCPEEVRWGFAKACEHASRIIVERHFEGHDHRILVIGGEVVAVAQRLPASVTGDGRRTIVELVQEVNRDPRRGEGHAMALTRIEIDDSVLHFLARQGLTPLSIPWAGQTVELCPTANLSTGGTAVDRTDDIHPENAMIARRAAAIVGLDIAGIDFISPDISRPVSETDGGIIEVNAGPGFRMHLQPSVGRARNVARPVLDRLFPNGATGRIPIFAITGTNGKTTASRMLDAILAEAGLVTGLTSTSGVYVGGRRIVDGDCSGPKSARLVLDEPGVEAAIFECARGGILREGLGFDQCDVGAVLNVSADHLGLKGIDTMEDLAAVKSVVVESVRRGGWSVLNADDPLTTAMARHAGGRVCFFTLRPEGQWPEHLREHVESGGRVVACEEIEDGHDIVIHEDGDRLFLMQVTEIPAAFNGWARCNVANAVAAIAMAHCHGIAGAVIRRAMRGFETTFERLPGRLNVYDGHAFRVIVDYAHNPQGLIELGDLVVRMRRAYHNTIGIIGIAGDRRDCDIRLMGALAARYFDTIVFKEDDMLRGREPGTIAALLREGALSTGCSPARIHTVLRENDAVDLALRLARARDLVVLTADHVELVWHQVTAFNRGGSESGGRRATVRRLRAS